MGDEWVSVDEKLPEAYTFVLVSEVTGRSGDISPISIARWEGDGWNGLGEDEHEANAFYSDLFWDISWEGITHWMPLPQPPKD